MSYFHLATMCMKTQELEDDAKCRVSGVKPESGFGTLGPALAAWRWGLMGEARGRASGVKPMQPIAPGTQHLAPRFRPEISGRQYGDDLEID